MAESDPQSSKAILPSFYANWLKNEGVPVLGGLMVKDVKGELPMGMWPRKGVKGVYLNLLGGDESLDSYIIEIPPAGQTEPEKYMFEEEVIVLSGRGASTVWIDDKKKQTFEWKEGSVFSPPMNSWRQHFNGSPDETVRLLVVSNAPVMMNLIRSTDFIFNCDYVFKERFAGEEDYFSPKGKALPNLIWRSNFINDIHTFKLLERNVRGAGGTGVNFEMANNTIRSHVAEFPVGTYKMAHRHGPGAHVLILSGTGFSLMWEEGKSKEKLEWAPGSFFVPPDMWFHQHFNTGTEPARYFAVHYGYWRVVVKDLGHESLHENAGNQIAYKDEDNEVLDFFLQGLKQQGATVRPLPEWRK
jgi:quercetin dioxygenase-like cupin family protein